MIIPAAGALTSGLLLKLGLISGGSALGGNLLTSILGNRRDKKMWELNNAYNTPAAQMARLKKAGLNPALVYGSSSVVGNTSAQRPQTQVPDIASTIPNLPQIYMSAKSAEKADASIELARQNKLLAEENKELVRMKEATESARANNLHAGTEKIYTDNLVTKGLYPYNQEIKRIQAEKIFPAIVQKYGLQNADLAFKVVESNPEFLRGMKLSNDEKVERIAYLISKNKIAGQLSNYNSTERDNLLYRLLIGSLYENDLSEYQNK